MLSALASLMPWKGAVLASLGTNFSPTIFPPAMAAPARAPPAALIAALSMSKAERLPSMSWTTCIDRSWANSSAASCAVW